jgi:hypothetical protein
MTAPYQAPPITLRDRRLAERPQGLARALGRATTATIIAACALSFVFSSIWPNSATAPGWMTLSLGMMYLAAMGLSAFTVATQLWCWIAPRMRGSLAVDAEGVHFERGFGVRHIPRARVEAGWLVHDREGAEVELQLRGGDVVSTSVYTPDEAHAVLDAAGVDPSKRALTMQLGGAAIRSAIAMGAIIPATCVASMVSVGLDAVVHMPSAALGFLIFTLVALCVPLSLRVFGPPRVQVGNDGVSVQEGFRSWFVPFDQIVSASSQGFDVALLLRDNQVRRIRAIGTGASRRAALLERIYAGIMASRQPRDLSSRLTVLDRNGRTLDDWKQGLHAVVNDRDAYRHTGLTRDEIAAALDDPQASPDRRIGAAYALSLADKQQAGARVRVVVDTVAHEPVRIALARAAEGELDEAVVTAASETRVRVG